MSDNTAVFVNYKKIKGTALGLYGVKHDSVDSSDTNRISGEDETFSTFNRAMLCATTMFYILGKADKEPEYGIRITFDPSNPNAIPQPTLLKWY